MKAFYKVYIKVTLFLMIVYAKPAYSILGWSPFTPAITEIYAINCMWINSKLNNDQQYICPAATPAEIQKKLLDPLIRWACVTPSYCSVILWYDSKLTPADAVKNTQELLESIISHSHKNLAPIILRDIWELRYVQNHPDIFSDKTPVYYRVDLLRMIATVENLENPNLSYFVYSDIDLQQTLSSQQLFDSTTQQHLKKYGMVIYGKNNSWFENGFHIVSKNNDNLLHALKYALIELNIERGYYALKNNTRNILPEIVYNSYRIMFKYFYHLEQYGILQNKDTGLPYDKEKDGYAPFGIDDIKYNSLEFVATISHTSSFDRFLPTKHVNLPPAAGGYYHDAH